MRKHYIDIQALREEDVVFNGDITRPRNNNSFNVGDRILIEEKFDGSNASFGIEEGKLSSYSHKKDLTYLNTLNGFYNLIDGFKDKLTDYINASDRDLVYFGEWSACRNKIVYNEDAKGKFYIFDVWDATNRQWLPFDEVKVIAKELEDITDGLMTLVHVLYDGPFISWEHIKTFMNSPFYGDRQEGVVVKNQDALIRNNEVENSRNPWIIKVVNTDFKESMIKVKKELDPKVEAAKQSAKEMMSQIVTRARVEKILIKLQQEEDVLPRELGADAMKLVAKVLPKAVFEDIVKEEPEIVKACGEYAGKTCSSITMSIARDILIPS